MEQVHELEVRLRLDYDQVHRQTRRRGDPLSDTRVRGQHHGEVTGTRAQRADELHQPIGVVHVARPVQGGEHEGPVIAERAPELGRDRTVAIRDQRVDHRVADHVDAGRVDALAQQVVAGTIGGREVQVGDRVGDQPVDLLGHLPGPGSQSALHVGDRHLRVLGGDRRGRGRVHIPDDHGQCGAMIGEDLGVGGHDRADLRR